MKEPNSLLWFTMVVIGIFGVSVGLYILSLIIKILEKYAGA